MTANESGNREAPPGSPRPVSLGLYILAAITFAGLVFLIGLIPGYEGGGRAIRYQSFGYYSLALITIYLFDPGRPLAGILPPSSPYLAATVVAVLYSHLVVLPLYFYFRTRRPWLLTLQFAFLCAHAAFALLVAAPFWTHQ
jgi:hypothetical protein